MSHNKNHGKQQENQRNNKGQESIGNQQKTAQTGGANNGGQQEIDKGEGSRDRNHTRGNKSR